MLVSEMKNGELYNIDLESLFNSPTWKRLRWKREYLPIDGSVWVDDNFNWGTRVRYLTFIHPNLSSVVRGLSMDDTDFLDTKELSEEHRTRAKFRGLDRGKYLTTGWDPEIFVVDGDNELIPAFNFLPDKKDPFMIAQPKRVKGSDKLVGSYAYWDGFQAEFSTIPDQCHGWGFDALRTGLDTILKKAKKHNPKARLTTQNVFELDVNFLATAQPEHVALGCDPSFNAYGTDPFMIENPFQLPYRMAGGHIHLGLNGGAPKYEQACSYAKYLDFLVGIPSVGMFAEIDTPIRRQFYGRAGEFRLPNHGIEYRTLSSAWLGHPAVGHLLMDYARRAIGVRIAERFKLSDIGLNDEYVRDVINNTDVAAARKIYRDNQIIWDCVASDMYSLENSIKAAHRIVLEGVESAFPTFRDVKRNWCLDGVSHWATHSNDSAGGTWKSATSNMKV